MPFIGRTNTKEKEAKTISTYLMLSLNKTTSDHNDFKKLVAQLDDDLHKRYGALQEVYNNYNQLSFIDTVLVAYSEELPVGCGCFRKFNDTTVEIKRMYVKPAYRGRGIATLILQTLEKWAKESGFSKAVLETGQRQQEAISLYLKNGYRIIENYGPYADLLESVCMEKPLE